MDTRTLYKIVFLLQFTAFFGFLISYASRSAVFHKPVKAHSSCNCAMREVLVCNQSHHDAVSSNPAVPPRAVLSSSHKVVSSHPSATSTSAVSQVRGPLSNCTLNDVKKRPGVMMLLTTNTAFVDMTMNLLESIKRVGVCVNTTIIAEDQTGYRYMHMRAATDPAVHVVQTDSGEMSRSIQRYSQQYFKLFMKRQPYMLSLLEKGLDVLFSDSDLFWFKDAFPYFKGDFDISLIDSKYRERHSDSNFCAGLIYLKPTETTLKFIRAWIEAMKNQSRTGRIKADQGIMNDLLGRDIPKHVNIGHLDTDLFPWGPKYYKLRAQRANFSTVVMHAASIRGHEAKVAKFKSSDMWLVNITNEDIMRASKT